MDLQLTPNTIENFNSLTVTDGYYIVSASSTKNANLVDNNFNNFATWITNALSGGYNGIYLRGGFEWTNNVTVTQAFTNFHI